MILPFHPMRTCLSSLNDRFKSIRISISLRSFESHFSTHWNNQPHSQHNRQFLSLTSFRTRHHNREQSTAFTTQQTVLFFHPLHPTPLHPHSCFFILRDVSFHISTCRYEVKSNFLPYLFLIRTGAKFLVGMLAHQQYKYFNTICLQIRRKMKRSC